MQPSGGVHNQCVAARVASFASRLAGQPLHQRRPSRLTLLVALVEPHFNGFRHHLELLARCRAVNVHRDQHGPVPALLEPSRQLAGGGGLAGALQSGHQNHAGRLRGELEPRRVLAQQRDQLVADDFDHLLGGRKRGEHLGSHGLHANLFDQLADHVEVDVGLKQRHANQAQGFGDVLFGERALAAKNLEGTLKFVCKGFKHGLYQCKANCGGAVDLLFPTRTSPTSNEEHSQLKLLFESWGERRRAELKNPPDSHSFKGFNPSAPSGIRKAWLRCQVSAKFLARPPFFWYSPKMM